MQVQTGTVTTTVEVEGIFLTEDEVRLVSYPLYKLLLLVNEDEKEQYPSLSKQEIQAVRDLKKFVDDFQGRGE